MNGDRREKLYDAITNISDTYVEEAQETSLAKKRINVKILRNYAAVAAVFVLVTVGAFMASHDGLLEGTLLNPDMELLEDSIDNEAVTEDAIMDDAVADNTTGDYASEEEANECIPYSGYVFPMTIAEKNDAVTATRNIYFDFVKNITIDAVVTDSYIFTNTSDADVTVTVLYPFESTYSYGDSIDNIPTLALNGEALNAKLKTNNYSQRIISESYLESEITIPAGESVTISAEIIKELDTRYEVVFCYELFTNEGSIIEFTEQTATIIENGNIKIVDQNFGFDLENDVNSVTLEQSVEYYYLEIN